MRNLVEQPHILMSVENAYHDASAPLTHDEAMQILSGGGKYGNVYPAKGKYGSKENTIFISNPSEAQRALAHKVAEGAGQDSLIESDGFSHKMIFVNGPNKGSVTHGKGTTWHEQEPEDYYTTLPTGEHFTHNFDSAENSVQKSEELEKSKNVREQRAKVFGTDPNAPRISNKRMKMMQAIQGYAQKKYGLPMTTGAGKRTMSGELRDEKGIEQEPFDVFTPKGHAEEKARQAKVKQLGLKRVDPKPDWRSGNIETQPSPDAAVHELAHIDLAPEGMNLPQFQVEMDRRHGQNQKDFGYMQNKRTSYEIQPMALENPIRRELGLPANRATKPVKQNEPVLDMPSEKRFVEGKDSKGRTVFYDRQSRLMNPETKERLAQIREGSLKFDPKSGWQPSSDVNALINLRGRGMGEEAQRRSKEKFSSSAQTSQPKKLAASEKMGKSEDPYSHGWKAHDSATWANGEPIHEDDMSNQANVVRNAKAIEAQLNKEGFDAFHFHPDSSSHYIEVTPQGGPKHTPLKIRVADHANTSRFHESPHINLVNPNSSDWKHVVDRVKGAKLVYNDEADEHQWHLPEKMSKSEQLRKRCWAGYKAIPGKKPYSKGSCAPVGKNRINKNESTRRPLVVKPESETGEHPFLEYVTKEYGYHDEHPIKKFFKEWIDTTQEHPFVQHRIHGFENPEDPKKPNFAFSDLSPDHYNPQTTVSIDWLQSHKKGSGAGSQALKEITDLADKHGVNLSLIAGASPSAKIKTTAPSRLKRFYGRHGFQSKTSKGSYMVRPANAGQIIKSDEYVFHPEDEDAIHELFTRPSEKLESAEKPFHGYSKEKHSRTGGLSDKYRKKYNRETGSNLKRPVTGKVKAGSKAAKRRKSFCARMSGVKGPTSKEGKLTPKGAALKRWKCSKSEELEKGSMQRLYPVPRTPQKPSGVAEWLQGGGDRDDVPREGDQNRRSRMLHKLSGLTKVRQRPDGTREFLLHRGENPEAYNVSLPSRSDPFLTHSEKTSWTPFFDQAYGHARDQVDHARDQVDEDDFKATPHAVHSAWIHEDNIRNIPLHYGALEDDKKDQNEWRGEHEVVVEPWHNSELLNSYDVTNEMPFRMPTSQDQVEMQRQSQGKLRHPTIDEKINARAGKALSANKNPTKLAASELEKARLEHYSSKQGLRSIDPKFKGTGVDVRTKGRDTEHPHSFFYRAGTTPEEIVSGQAKSKYTVNIPDEMPLYDLATDNEGHIASAVEQNQGALNMDMVHQRLKDAGYQGFYNSAHPQLSNVVALYHEQPVSEEEGMGKSWYNSSYSSKKRKAELQIDKQKHPEKYNINNEEINRKIAEEFLSSKKDHENPLKNKKQPVQKQEGTDCDDHLDPLKKPYASEAQRRWAHTEAGTKALGGKKAVAHWDEQSRGKDLPEKVKKKDYSLEKVSRADVANSHILMFPVSINGQHRDEHEDLPDYHVTLKWMGDTPHKTVDEIENIVNKHGLSAPKSFNIRPHVFNTPNGPAHVLLLGGNLETLHNAKKEIDEGKPDRYPEYLPHITVSKKIHDAIKNGTMSAEDLNIRVHPLEYRIGDQIVKRFDSTR